MMNNFTDETDEEENDLTETPTEEPGTADNVTARVARSYRSLIRGFDQALAEVEQAASFDALSARIEGRAEGRKTAVLMAAEPDPALITGAVNEVRTTFGVVFSSLDAALQALANGGDNTTAFDRIQDAKRALTAVDTVFENAFADYVREFSPTFLEVAS